MHEEAKIIGPVACDHIIAVLEQPSVAVVGVAGEHRVERQACRSLLLEWAVGFATMHHHLVLYDHAAVVDRRQEALWRLEWAVRPVGEATGFIQ